MICDFKRKNSGELNARSVFRSRKLVLTKGVFQSGQMGQTVNLLLFSFGGSNPSAPTSRSATRSRRLSATRSLKRLVPPLSNQQRAAQLLIWNEGHADAEEESR